VRALTQHTSRALLLNKIESLDPYKEGELEERLRLRKEIEKIDAADLIAADIAVAIAFGAALFALLRMI